MPRGARASAPTRQLAELVEKFARAADGKMSAAATARIGIISLQHNQGTVSGKTNPDGRPWALREFSTVERLGGGLGALPTYGRSSVKLNVRSALSRMVELAEKSKTKQGKPVAILHQYGAKHTPRDAATGLQFAGSGKRRSALIAAHVARGGKLIHATWRLPVRGILPKKRIPRKWHKAILKDLREKLPEHFATRKA